MNRTKTFLATTTAAFLRRRNRGWLLALGIAFFAFAPGTASAQTLLDPSTLQIGPGTTTDPVQIGSSGYVTVFQNQGGAGGNLSKGWYLIIGIPNVTTSNSPATITTINSSPQLTPVTAILNATLTSGQKAYDELSYSSVTNDSNSFTNWSSYDKSINGIKATSFGLYEYNIPVTLTAKGTDTFQFSNLPQGTFVIAYGTNSTHVYDTPFTEAGMTTGPFTATPEPSTMAISTMGTLGLIGYGLCRRRKK